jgi:hypothetical protein
MMRWNTFARSALFAAVAAAAWLPWALVVVPVLGVWHARALYLILATAAYVAGLSTRRARAVPIAALILMLGGGIAIVATSTTALAVGLAVLLGGARSGVLYRASPVRAVATEALLVVAGLLFARFLGGFGLVATALAIWGFLLVQSVFFLVGGVRLRPIVERGADPFEEAHKRALVLLDRTGACDV